MGHSAKNPVCGTKYGPNGPSTLGFGLPKVRR
jgi:hypothetical protein